MTNFKIFRIIDANINRAVEGLRVMEEVARFVLEEKSISSELKNLRAKIRHSTNKLIDNETHYQQRKSETDVGRKSYSLPEKRRKSIIDVFLANAKRVQEALRVLEEFSKLIDQRAGKLFKEARFRVYDLEKQAFLLLNKKQKLDFDLYVVTDPAFDHLAVAKKALANGVKMIQLRDKTASKEQLTKWARQMVAMAHKAGATFIMNDFADIAKEVGADGVHLGQEDLQTISIKKVRNILGPEGIIGLSTHSLEQAKQAAKLDIDYVSCGPIFKTPSKPLGRPLGLKVLRRVIKNVKLPVVAIGGINSSNIDQVRKAGCRRTAFIRAAQATGQLKPA